MKQLDNAFGTIYLFTTMHLSIVCRRLIPFMLLLDCERRAPLCITVFKTGCSPSPTIVLFSPNKNKIARSIMHKSHLRILFSAFHAVTFPFLVRADKVFDHCSVSRCNIPEALLNRFVAKTATSS